MSRRPGHRPELLLLIATAIVALVVVFVVVFSDRSAGSSAPAPTSLDRSPLTPSTSSSGNLVGSPAIGGPSEVPTVTLSPASDPAPSTTIEVTVGTPNGDDLGVFSATCYTLRGTTATGSQAGPGTIAVDPNVIELGTVLDVDGYGRGTARDTGGAIKGRRLDLWMSSLAECRQWGRRSVEVRRVA